MARLRFLAEKEIKDIDTSVSKEEVLAAIRSAVPADAADRYAEVTTTEITGIWTLSSVSQIATVKISRWLLSNLCRIKIRWAIARVWERIRHPVRYYRCHDFGHISRTCGALDLSRTL